MAAALSDAEKQLSNGNLVAAIESANSAVATLAASGDTVGQAKALSIAASANLSKRNQHEALKLASEAVVLFEGQPPSKDKLSAFMTQCDASMVFGDLESALEAGKKARRIAKDIGDTNLAEQANQKVVFCANTLSGTGDGLGGGRVQTWGAAELFKANDPLQTTKPPKNSTKAQINFKREAFSWRNVTSDFTWCVTYPKSDPTPRNWGFQMLGTSVAPEGPKNVAMPLHVTMREKTDDLPDNDAWNICIIPLNSGTAYCTQLMNQLNALSCLQIAKLSNFTFINLNEGVIDRSRADFFQQIPMTPVSVAIQRTCRIEWPKSNIGNVALDLASWFQDRSAVIDKLAGCHDDDQCELHYQRGQTFVPLLAHRGIGEEGTRRIDIGQLSQQLYRG